MTTTTDTSTASKIASLNDCFRRHPGADWMVTAGVQAKGPVFVLCQFERRRLLPQFSAFRSWRRVGLFVWPTPSNLPVQLHELDGSFPRIFARERLIKSCFPALDKVVDAVVGDEHRSSIANVWDAHGVISCQGGNI